MSGVIRSMDRTVKEAQCTELLYFYISVTVVAHTVQYEQTTMEA